MSSSRKSAFVYHERKVRDEQEIQTILLEDDDDDDDDEEKDEERPSNGRWVVEKSSKSPCRTPAILTKCNQDSSQSKPKENGKVSPLKIKRKLSYAVNRVETPKERPDILPTIDLITSDEEDREGIPETLDSKHSKNTRRSVKSRGLSTKNSGTPRSKKMAKSDSDSDDSDFEVITPSKHKKSQRKTEVTCNDDEVQTLPMKRLSSEKNNETEESNISCTPSKRRKQLPLQKSSTGEASTNECALPLSSRILQNNKENLIFKTPEKSLESKLSRVFVALDRLELPEYSSSSARKNGHSTVQLRNTPIKQTPTKIQALKSAVALSKADTTPIKGITPGKGNTISSAMTPTKGTTPSKSPAKPSEAGKSSEDEFETAKPSRTPRARRKTVAMSEDDDEAGKPSRRSRAGKKVVTSSDDEFEAAKPSRTSRAKKKVVTSSEDEEEVAKPTRTPRARKKTADSRDEEDEPATPSRSRMARKSKASPAQSPTESPTRSLRQRDQIKRTERFSVGITPRRSTRFSMSPSTPSLRQKVLMANTPRSSLPPLKDEDESEDEFLITPRKTPKSAKKKLDMTPITPTSGRKVGHGFLSPVVAEREGKAPATPSSALGIARAQLQVSTLPTSLPCREKEFNDIKSFITRKLQDGTGGCMYISGVPGTGKTATVHTVVKTLQKMALDGEITQFDFVEVNGLRMTEPRQAYVRIWQILSKDKTTADLALKHLENKFLGKPKKCTVLLVDELDYLCNRRQDVIYNILDWTTKRYSKFIVLTIANTMDLPERTLKGKVTSRMGLTRLVFQPYTYQQLEEIVLNRLDGCKAFHADAVQLVARKVAAVSGDARRALDICRRSTEILELEGRSSVSVLDIQKVLTQIFAGSRVQAIKNSSLMAKLILRAIRDEVLRTGVEETTVAFIHPQLVSICALEGKREPTVTDILTICTNLADSGLIFAENGRKDINRKISLNISTDDIHYAIDC